MLRDGVFGPLHSDVADGVVVCVRACRQRGQRARQHGGARRPRFEVDRARHAELVERFTAACNGADLDELLDLLTADATYVADGGATTKAARHPIVGATRVSRFMAYVYGRRARSKSAERIELNGEPAIAIYFRGKLDSVLFIEPGPDDRATTIYALRNPEKLARIRATLPGPT